MFLVIVMIVSTQDGSEKVLQCEREMNSTLCYYHHKTTTMQHRKKPSTFATEIYEQDRETETTIH